MTTESDSGADARPRDDGAPAGDAAVEVRVEVEPAEEPGGELAARVASLEAQLALAQEKARETFAQLKDEHEKRLRATADLENARKRAQRERDEVQKFGSERLLKDLLPVVDNLDRALAAAPADEPLAKGVRLVRKAFEEALARHGVEAFSAMGEPFDPRRHEALAQLHVDGAEPGSVVVEHARGFLLHGRLLRPAMVAVAPPRAAAPVEAAAPAEETRPVTDGASDGGDRPDPDRSERGSGGPRATRMED